MTRGMTVLVTVAGQTYKVTPGWGRYAGSPVLPGQAKPVKSEAEMLLGLIQRGGA